MKWSDLTIRNYQDVCKEVSEEYEDDLARSIGLLSVLTGKSIAYYNEKMPLNELRDKLTGLNFLNEPCPKVKLHSKIRVGKRRFRFNLNIRTISAGQYIDLTELVKDREKINDNLHTILAVLCEEINWFGKVKEVSVQERAKYFLDNMRMPYVLSLAGFFLSNYQRLIKGTESYLESEMKKMKTMSEKAINQALSSIGDGTIL